MSTNPFHLLGLPTDADNETVSARTEELLSTAAGPDEQRALLNQARQALLNDRPLQTLLEVPGTDYRDEEWDRLIRLTRRPPAVLEGIETALPRRDDFRLDALLELVLHTQLGIADDDGAGTPVEEITHVLFG